MPEVDRNSQSVELAAPHLWWVLHGTLHLTVHDGAGPRIHHITAGTAVSVDRGMRITVRRSAGTTALGFPVPDDATLPFTPDSPVTCADLTGRSDNWHGRLIATFADSLNYLSTPTGVEVGDSSLRPRMPDDPAARAAARLLLAGGDLSVAALADAVYVSPSTLNRRFLAGTGLTVGAWRARLRVSQAAELLAGGSSVESAAHRVGLSSASALCHLVRRTTGLTPAQLGDRVREAPSVPARPAGPALLAQPTLHTWPRVNRFHVLLWAWRGRCSVTLGDTTTDLQEGELLWVPAGVPNHVAMEPGALVLPVGARAGRPAAVASGQDAQDTQTLPRPQSTAVTGESPDALLAAVGREYDPVAPEQTALVDRLFYTFLAGAGDTHGSRLLRRLTEEFRRHPDIDRSLTGWADRLDCTTGDLTDALGLVGADSVRRWASTVRMTMARHLLASGIPVSAVARHLGYSGTASFSHVFRRAHGVPPRAWHGYV